MTRYASVGTNAPGKPMLAMLRESSLRGRRLSSAG